MIDEQDEIVTSCGTKYKDMVVGKWYADGRMVFLLKPWIGYAADDQFPFANRFEIFVDAVNGSLDKEAEVLARVIAVILNAYSLCSSLDSEVSRKIGGLHDTSNN